MSIDLGKKHYSLDKWKNKDEISQSDNEGKHTTNVQPTLFNTKSSPAKKDHDNSYLDRPKPDE